MLKFSLTNDVAQRLIKMISTDGHLAVEIERVANNTFKVYGCLESDRIIEMPPINLEVGSVLRLDGVYVQLDALDVQNKGNQ